MTASTQFRGFLRCLATLAAVVFLLGDVLGFLHQAIEQHTRCGEHGELLHAEDEALSEPIEAAAGITAELRSTDRDRSHRIEDHCKLCPSNHEPNKLEIAAMDAGGVLPGDDGPSSWAAEETARGLVVYRMAPKTSPPWA